MILWAGVLFFGYRIYMEHRMTIPRSTTACAALLYGSLVVVALTLVATIAALERGRRPRRR